VRLLKWVLVGLLAVAITVVVFFPAAWIAAIVEDRTDGRIVLGNPQGTLWNGSATLGAAAGRNDPAGQLLPGRFEWRLSPMVLLGQVNARIGNDEALLQPVRVTGNWRQWQVSPSSVDMSAERLVSLGAPLNTLQPSGSMRLAWETLQLRQVGQEMNVTGKTTLTMNDIASRLSPIRPLGDYRMTFNWQGQRAKVDLDTINGPLLLAGNGTIVNGRLRFSGTAQAAQGYEERLANLLNLLGQRRRIGGKDVIALEFK
jgi:general secretion pathway protein N